MRPTIVARSASEPATIDSYMDTREVCERLAAQVMDCKKALLEFSELVEQSPSEALLAIPPDWPSRGDLHRLLSDIATAWLNMGDAWAALPPEKRRGIPEPIRSLSPAIQVIQQRPRR